MYNWTLCYQLKVFTCSDKKNMVTMFTSRLLSKKVISSFFLFAQVGVPHDDNDMHDRHVLPAGHSRRPRLEHVNPAATQSQSVCLYGCVSVHVASATASAHCNMLCNLSN